MLSSRISLKSLSVICRSLSTMLASGVDIVKAFQLAGGKAGATRYQSVLSDVSESLKAGNDVVDALQEHSGRFPTLMVDMVSVGEQTGMLPEVLAHLADHYENSLRLRKNFLTAITWPAIQLVAAILIIALVIFIFGMIADKSGPGELGPPIQLFWGLSGASGAIIWLAVTFGSLLGFFALYQILTRFLGARRYLDPLFMQIPVLGSCMRSFAIARFSWAYYLTQQTGMPMVQSLTTSLRATGNGAFTAAIPEATQRVKSGEDITSVLSEIQLFPPDFIEMVHVGETSGTVPETLHRLSPRFEDDARRSLSAVATAAGWLVWMAVAAFIIYFIFKIILWYVGLINDLANGAM